MWSLNLILRKFGLLIHFRFFFSRRMCNHNVTPENLIVAQPNSWLCCIIYQCGDVQPRHCFRWCSSVYSPAQHWALTKRHSSRLPQNRAIAPAPVRIFLLFFKINSFLWNLLACAYKWCTDKFLCIYYKQPVRHLTINTLLFS